MPRGSRPERVQFSSKKGGSPGRGEGLPASFGTEGVGGLGGAVRGARGWGAGASRLAHGGGGGGPSLRSLPGGGVCGGGSGSVVHRGFYPQPLFRGCGGVGSSGSQFSTGPEDGGSGDRKRIIGQTGSRLLSLSEWKARSALGPISVLTPASWLLGSKYNPTPGPLHGCPPPPMPFPYPFPSKADPLLGGPSGSSSHPPGDPTPPPSHSIWIPVIVC